MAVNDGSDIWVMVSGSLVNGLTDKSFAMTVSELNATTQDSGEWEEYIAGLANATISVTCKHDESDTYTLEEIITAAATKASVAFIFGKGVKTTGGRIYSGNAIITAVNENAPMNDVNTFDFTLRVTGTPTFATSTTTVA